MKRSDRVYTWLVSNQSLVNSFLTEAEKKQKSKKLLEIAKAAQTDGIYASSSGVQAIKSRMRGHIEKYAGQSPFVSNTIIT